MDDAPMILDQRLAAVIIGRNEGERLKLSLGSVERAGLRAVYVDSGSRDGSPEVGRKLEVPVVELDPASPFSAGRGRNEGLDEAQRRWPAIDYVMFLDGDCILDPGFPAAALAAFADDDRRAIVTGHLSEQYADRSIYNRLCAIEWRSPAGPIENMNGLGGIMMVRITAFREVGGFNLQAIAGEEPDLGARLVLGGYRIIKIDQPMATHDAAILRFGQWWMRAVRGGHALAHRYTQHGRSSLRDGRRELLSDLLWGLALPIAVLTLLWPTRGWSLLLAAGYGMLGWRVTSHYRRSGWSGSDARLVARFIVLSKFAHVIGIGRFIFNRMRGRFRIIEYK